MINSFGRTMKMRGKSQSDTGYPGVDSMCEKGLYNSNFIVHGELARYQKMPPGLDQDRIDDWCNFWWRSKLPKEGRVSLHGTTTSRPFKLFFPKKKKLRERGGLLGAYGDDSVPNQECIPATFLAGVFKEKFWRRGWFRTALLFLKNFRYHWTKCG